MKYNNLTLGQIEAIVNKLGGMEGVQRLLRGELIVTDPACSTSPATWREEDGVISFTVTSGGTTGEAWITRLEAKGFRLMEYAKNVLMSPDFKPTTGVTYHVAVLKGSLFPDDRVTKRIRTEAAKRGLVTPHPEVACLIRELFSDADLKAMGLTWLITMHEPIEDSAGYPDLLSAIRRDDGSWLSAGHVRPGTTWYRDAGFAFLVPPA